jgi:hypothetical protein
MVKDPSRLSVGMIGERSCFNKGRFYWNLRDPSGSRIEDNAGWWSLSSDGIPGPSELDHVLAWSGTGVPSGGGYYR